ncbi:MAG: PhoH family protein [Endomicrobia bacterium]|nr:PhoH family protein [Endomicrobiia bacterium]MCX7940270.1 PhoH family protein [Endomicrobiia bacterium]MDW8055826.1 PhoH family protein [Elusimicrobiota bacterium]
MKKKIYVKNQKELLNLIGEQDKNIRYIEKHSNVEIYYYPLPDEEGFEINIVGSKENVERAYNFILNISSGKLAATDLHKKSVLSEEESRRSLVKKYEYLAYDGEIIKPKTSTQKLYVELMDEYDIVVAIGPAGTGKTFLAVMSALIKLDRGDVYKVVLTRPVVEAGERLGFLPGDLYDKINPYLKPLYDAFFVMLGPDKFKRYLDEEIIEIIPLAYMRGRTLNDAFIILDEGQNTTPEQMKMFLTRLGYNSQLVITGDITQIDLDYKTTSGLVLITKILKDIEEIKFVYFTEEDIVRHKLVKKIVKAYEKWEGENK